MFEVFTLLIVIYCILILYLRLSDNDNGNRKNIAGWLLFGLMWPQMRQKIEKDSKNKEIIFIIMLIAFMIATVVFTYLITEGELSLVEKNNRIPMVAITRILPKTLFFQRIIAENRALIGCYRTFPINPPPPFITGTTYCGDFALTTYCDFGIYCVHEKQILIC